MKTILRTSTPALHTHSTVIQLKDGNVGIRILLTGIDHLTIGCLYMYADDDGYYHDNTSQPNRCGQ